MPRAERSSGWAAAGAAVFLAGVAVALLFAFAFPLPPVRDDAVEYLTLARNVAAGRGFSMDGETPSSFRPPLFSFLLGGWFLATGTSSPESAAVFQSLVHGAGALASFFLFLEIAPSLAWAAVAGLAVAVHPVLATRPAFVLQEPTLLLFTTLALLASVRLLRAPSAARAGFAGAAWGVCTLGKVVAWFGPLLLLGMRLLPGGRKREWTGRESAALLLCFLATLAPWALRNGIRFHRLIPVNSEGAAMVEWAVGRAEPRGERPGEEFVRELDRERVGGEERERRLWEYIKARPAHFAVERVAANAVRFAGPARAWWIARGSARLGEHGVLFWALAVLFHIPFYLFFLLRGIAWVRGRADTASGFLFLFYAVYWAQYAVLWAEPRFAVPVFPVLVALALSAGRAGHPMDGSPAPAR